VNLAVELGADALGFICWQGSPRQVNASAIRDITADVPAFIARVGVFVNATLDEILRVVDEAALDVVQLHGDETVGPYLEVPARLVKAMSIASDDDLRRAEVLPSEVTLLVDAADPISRGGTGRVADWTRAAALARRRPVILAGGLSSMNVRE